MPNTKLPQTQRQKMIDHYQKTQSLTLTAKKFGISPARVSQIKNNYYKVSKTNDPWNPFEFNWSKYL